VVNHFSRRGVEWIGFAGSSPARVLQAALADRSSQNIVHPTACLPSLLNELRQGQTVTHVHVGTSLARKSNLFLYLLMPLTDRATHRTRSVDSTMHAGCSRSNFIHFTLCSSHQSNNNNNNNSNLQCVDAVGWAAGRASGL